MSDESQRIVAVLDANVLYSGTLTDIFLWLNQGRVIRVHWSAMIEAEWTRNLGIDRPDLLRERIVRRAKFMNEASPGASVTDFEHLIERISLPDADDRHVLAAAIAAEANVIVTSNLRDFPEQTLAAYGIVRRSPDEILVELFDAQPEDVLVAVRQVRAGMKSPPLSANELLERFRRNGLQEFANRVLPESATI